MPEEKVVKVEHLVTALSNIQYWCGVVRDALLQLNQNQEITVPEAVHDDMVKTPPQNIGGCKSFEE